MFWIRFPKLFPNLTSFSLDDVVVGKWAENYAGSSVENWVDDSEQRIGGKSFVSATQDQTDSMKSWDDSFILGCKSWSRG